MSKDTKLKRAVWDYVIETVRALDSEFGPTYWDAQVDPVHAVIVLGHTRTATWAPDLGWYVQATHGATRTPDGKALYLDAGPVPPPAVVADRFTAWAEERLVLTEAQPFYRHPPGGLVTVLRDAVSGRAVQRRCSHCGRWETAKVEAEDVFCSDCGTYIPQRGGQARVTPNGSDTPTLSPMTPERDAEIRAMDGLDALGADAPYNEGVWELNAARKDLLAELDTLRRGRERLRAELLAEEARLLDAREHVTPRAKHALDNAARRLRTLADTLSGTEAGRG